jgi:type III polyketide synthase
MSNIPLISLQKLLYLNRKTGILSRPTILDYTQWTKVNSNPPSIDELSRIFMAAGVNLAASACTKAMEEARLSPTNITHIVAVTCTGQGNPGYDLFVSEKLGLSSNVQRVLLHGVGCAGGLSAVRTAADIASAASQRGRPARILVVACELCSLFLRAELQAACRDGEALHVAPALFSDAAAAVVVCNKIALGERHEPLLELLEWSSMVVPGTTGMMSYDIEENGNVNLTTGCQSWN